MKKILYGMMAGGVLLTSSGIAVCASENLDEKTELSVTLVRKPIAGQVPGVEEEYTKPSTPQINGNNKLPQTNEQTTQLYPFLGLLLVGVSGIICYLKNGKEEK